MMKFAKIRVLGLALVLLLAVTSIANAQATRTWVSGVGDDANPCSRTAPCKTFAGAISKTAPAGEINVLDPGGFGAVTITKSISIEADGVIAGVLVSGTNAIVIAAGANDQVTLRGLTIEGIGTGLNGVKVIQAGAVRIDHCYINGFVNEGVDVEPTTTATTVTIQDTTIRNTVGTNPNGFGVYVKPASSAIAANVLINRSILNNNSGGLRVEVGGKATVRDSAFSFNGNAVTANGGGLVSLESTVLANNTNGVVSSGGSTVRLSNTSIFDNSSNAINMTGGTVLSFINNRIVGTILGGTLTNQAQQ